MICYSLGIILDNKEVENEFNKLAEVTTCSSEDKLNLIITRLVKEKMEIIKKKNIINYYDYSIANSSSLWLIPLKNGNKASYAKIKDILWVSDHNEEKIKRLKEEYISLCEIAPNYPSLLTLERHLERLRYFESYKLLLKNNTLIAPIIARQSDFNSKILDEYTKLYRKSIEIQNEDDWFVLVTISQEV